MDPFLREINHHYLRIIWVKSETPINKRRRIRFTRTRKLINNIIKIQRRRTMNNANNSKSFPMRLKIFPRTRSSTAEYEFEAKWTGIPRLMSERGFLVFGVERADGGERDGVEREEEGVVVAEEWWWDWSNWDYGDLDCWWAFYAYFWFHCLWSPEWVVSYLLFLLLYSPAYTN